MLKIRNNILPYHLKSFYLLIICHLVLIVAFLIYQKPLFAADNGQTIVILDGSRSMWGKLEQDRKYVSVISETKALLSTLDKEQQVGIIAFGNKRRRNCKDINIIKPTNLPLSDYSQDTLDKFKPIGSSPISTALETAASFLEPDGFNKIVLIVDGYESCRKNPCKTIDKIQKTHENLLIDVIGLKLRQRDKKRYSCLDKNNSVQMHFVKNEIELARAYASAFNNVEENKKPNTSSKYQQNDQVDSLLSGQPRMKLLAVQSAGQIPLNSDLSWKVYKYKKDKSFDDIPIAETKNAQPLINLKPGKYIVHVEYGRINKSETVIIPEQGAITHIITLNSGSLNLQILDSRTKLPLNNVSYIIKPNAADLTNKNLIIRGNKQVDNLRLEAGKYKVITKYAGVLKTSEILIKAAQSIDHAILLDIGSLELQTIAIKGGRPLRNITYTLYKGAFDTASKALVSNSEILRTAAAEPKLNLQSGTYTILTEHDLVSTIQNVLIQTGKLTRSILNLEANIINLKSNLEGRPLEYDISYQIMKKGKNGYEEIARTYQASPSYTLPAGHYRIISRYGKVNARAYKNIKLLKNDQKDIGIAHSSGEIKLALIDKRHKLPKVNVFWQIFDKDNKEIWSSSRPTPQIILQSGEYKVIGENNDKEYSKSFKVENGNKNTINLIAE